MKKKLIVIGSLIAAILISLICYKSFLGGINTEMENKIKNVVSSTHKQLEKIDVSPIANTVQSKDLGSFKGKDKLSKLFDSYTLIVSNSTNLKLNMKIDNGIREMISCNYKRETPVKIDIRVCNSSSIAEKWYDSEFKHTNDIFESSDELNNKWFLSKTVYKSDNSRVTRVGFQKGNVIIILSEDKANGELNSNINQAISCLAQILKGEFTN